jgi:hypothetical protein
MPVIWALFLYFCSYYSHVPGYYLKTGHGHWLVRASVQSTRNTYCIIYGTEPWKLIEHRLMC